MQFCAEKELSRINPILTGAEVADQNTPRCDKFLRSLAFVHLLGQDPILENSKSGFCLCLLK